LGKLPLLARITSNDNSLDSLPPQLGILNEVGFVSLSLAGNSFQKIPAVVFSLVGLKSISFTNNQLSEIPPQIGRLLELEDLFLDANCITSLPGASELCRLGLCVAQTALELLFMQNPSSS
jgi:Leucine-rich repeat (LRR) protein